MKNVKAIHSIVQNQVERHFIRQKAGSWAGQYYNHMSPNLFLQEIERRKVPDVVIIDERFCLATDDKQSNPIKDVLAGLKSQNITIPTVIVIMNDDQVLDVGAENRYDRAIQYFKLGASDFIYRPTSSEELGDQLTAILRRSYEMESLGKMVLLARELWFRGLNQEFVPLLATIDEEFGASAFLQVLLIEVERRLGQFEESLSAAHLAAEMLPDSLIVREEIARTLLASGQREIGFQQLIEVCRHHMTEERASYLSQVVTVEDSVPVNTDDIIVALQLLAATPKAVAKEVREQLFRSLLTKAHDKQDVLFVLELLRINPDLRSDLARDLLVFKKLWPCLESPYSEDFISQIIAGERAEVEQLLYNIIGGIEPRPQELLMWTDLLLARGDFGNLEQELTNFEDKYKNVPEWYYCMSSVLLADNKFAESSKLNLAGLRLFNDHPLLQEFKVKWRNAYDAQKQPAAS